MGIHFHQRDQFVRIVELTPALRRKIEATVESLIALLDSYDGDENTEDDTPLEDGADEEPTLGAGEEPCYVERYRLDGSICSAFRQALPRFRQVAGQMGGRVNP